MFKAAIILTVSLCVIPVLAKTSVAFPQYKTDDWCERFRGNDGYDFKDCVAEMQKNYDTARKLWSKLSEDEAQQCVDEANGGPTTSAKYLRLRTCAEESASSKLNRW